MTSLLFTAIAVGRPVATGTCPVNPECLVELDGTRIQVAEQISLNRVTVPVLYRQVVRMVWDSGGSASYISSNLDPLKPGRLMR